MHRRGNECSGKIGSQNKSCTSSSQIGYPAAQSHGFERYSRHPSSLPVATFANPTAAEPGHLIRHISRAERAF